MSTNEQKERRAKRISLELPIRVEAQEKKNVFWSEVTHLINVSPLGASFYLKRKFSIGQLLLLTIPLPHQLRCFDYTEQQYCVWSIVRHCSPLTATDSSVYRFGVAFVGKHPPHSYKENPLRLYKLSGVTGSGLWQIGKDEQPELTPRSPRYAVPINVYLAIIDDHENIVAHERTVTENISLGGAAVFSSLPIKVGDLVKVICDEYNVTLLAEVRNLRCGMDGLPRLHLKFLSEEFPLKGIEQM